MDKDELIKQLSDLARQYDERDSENGDAMRKLISELESGYRDTTSIQINATMTLKKFDGDGTDSEPVETIIRKTGL